MAAAHRDSRDSSGPDVEVEPQPAREPDYYGVLGIAPGASEAEIRAAFRRLAKIWHPDRHGADSPDMRARAERRMRAILRAYGVLGTPAARANYDLRRAGGRLTVGGYSDASPFSTTDHAFAYGGWRHPLAGASEKRAPDSFAGTLGGVLALLLALGIAGHLIRSSGEVSGPGGLVELAVLFALLVLAVALLAGGSPLARAGDAYFERDPSVDEDVSTEAATFAFDVEGDAPTPFERLVEDALADVPAEFQVYLENVVVRVKDEPSEEDLRRMRMEPCSLLLGLYEGVPLTAQGAYEHPPQLVTIFRRPIEAYCGDDPSRIRRQVRATVLHELAHHFGMNHDAMPEWIK